ncbi:unnamed protein product [Penicillium camemberti]|uniref:Str. FM013 n=1 Tax=Penicillium camemberti (strain FM 013) TaxID=1429867 RepID=A0A0G4NXR3_PENC3|nr:unnamed protein product [Penicillium camemberti]
MIPVPCGSHVSPLPPRCHRKAYGTPSANEHPPYPLPTKSFPIVAFPCRPLTCQVSTVTAMAGTV